MFGKYLTEALDLYNEIISRKEFKQLKKRPEVDTMDMEEYKKNLPILKNIFKTLNKGKFTRNIILDYNSIKVQTYSLTSHDRKLISTLQALGYEVSEESYMLGICKKAGKIIVIDNVVQPLLAKDVNKLKEALQKNPENKAIALQIDAVENIKYEIDYASTLAYDIAQSDKFKIVLSIEPLKIASQSTKVGWTSCMNLTTGINKHYVMAGISEGVIIAYLVKTGDEKTLNSPTARVLIKPLKDLDDPKNIIWEVDQVYGTAPGEFTAKVSKIFEPFNGDINAGYYKLSNNIYADRISNIIGDGKKSNKELVKIIYSKLDAMRYSNNKEGETIITLLKDVPNSVLYQLSTDFYIIRDMNMKEEGAEELVKRCLKINEYDRNIYSRMSSMQEAKFSPETMYEVFKYVKEDAGTTNTIKKLNTKNKIYIYSKTKDQNIKEQILKQLPPIYRKRAEKQSGKKTIASMSEKEFIDFIINDEDHNYHNISEYFQTHKLTTKQNRKFHDDILKKLVDSNKADKETLSDLFSLDNYYLDSPQYSKYFMATILDAFKQAGDKDKFYISKDRLYEFGKSNILKYFTQIHSNGINNIIEMNKDDSKFLLDLCSKIIETEGVIRFLRDTFADGDFKDIEDIELMKQITSLIIKNITEETMNEDSSAFTYKYLYGINNNQHFSTKEKAEIIKPYEKHIKKYKTEYKTFLRVMKNSDKTLAEKVTGRKKGTRQIAESYFMKVRRELN